jgi:heme-degrading monooxygenase HmoA
MYVVIFKAKIRQLDDEYYQNAKLLRERAISKFGCIDFVSVQEKDCEVSLSYWQTEEQISTWKSDPVHVKAQELGRHKWYESYQVEVVEIKRRYPK